MKTGLYTGLSDEKLVEIYKETEDERAFEQLMKNTEQMRYSIAERYLNIPDSEVEDLMSEGAMEMLVAVKNYDSAQYKASFKSFLYTAISRKYKNMFRVATSKKRDAHGMVLSYEQINGNCDCDGEENTLGNIAFSVECEDYSMTEIAMVVEALELSERERVVVNLLMGGMDKPDIARTLGVKTPSVHKYIERIGKKMILSGVFA